MMNDKHWREWPGYCGECGYGDVEIYTDQTKDGWCRDGDEVRCNECGAKGTVQVNAEDDIWIDWEEL